MNTFKITNYTIGEIALIRVNSLLIGENLAHIGSTLYNKIKFNVLDLCKSIFVIKNQSYLDFENFKVK